MIGFVKIDFRQFGSLSHPDEDDGYLFEADERRERKSRVYNPADDWDENEAVEADFCEN